MAGLGLADERDGPVEAGLGVGQDLRPGGQGVLQAGGELALVTADREQRGGSDGGQEGGAVVVRLGDGLGAPLLDGVVGAHGEPVLDLVVGVDLEGQAAVLVLVATEDTVVHHVVDGGEEVAAVIAALEAHGVAVAPGGDEDLAAPVHVGHPVIDGVGTRDVAFAEVALGQAEVDIILRAHDIQAPGQGGEGELVVVEDLAFSLLAGLRSHEHDAVTGLGTVDGRGGGILQDLDGLDHFRVQVLDVVHLQAVHDEERSQGTGIGGITADADIGPLARRTGSVDDLDTGGLALEGGGRVGSRAVLEVLTADGGHGTGQVALFLDAVTDHDGLVEEHRILLEDDTELGLVPDGNDLFGIADAGDADGSPGGDAEAECAVQAGDGSDRGIADEDHGRTHDGRAGFIDDNAADGTVLGGCDRSQESRRENHRDGGHSCKKLPCHTIGFIG